MFDEFQRLCENHDLCTLLSHYAELGNEDRQVWRDRLLEMEGVQPRTLVRLHGELLAYGYLEQNTGVTPQLEAGTAPQCYRVTPAGLKAWKASQSQIPDQPAEAELAPI